MANQEGFSTSSPWRSLGTRPVLGLLAWLLLPAGFAWLAYNAWNGAHNGRDADIHRRWIVCQYVRHGLNPYPIALAALERVHGCLGGARQKPRLYAIPRLTPEAAATDPRVPVGAAPLLATHRTPEAVYPPSVDLLLAVSLGCLPEEQVHLVWLLVNLALLASCVSLLCWLPPTGGRGTPLGVAAILLLVLLWSPTQDTLRAGQFSLLVTVCILLGFHYLKEQEYLAGVFLSLALIKPSLALPFLIFPLVRGRWRALAVVGVLHLGATCIQAARFGCAPWELLRQWTQVAAYFTQGQFTLQEVLNALRLADTPIGLALVAGFMLLVFAWCWANRAAGDASLLDLLCFASVLWTYHGPYDFVILLIPLVRRVVPLLTTGTACFRWWPGPLVALVTFACISLAASSVVYGDESHLASRIVRHGARLLLWLWFAGLALQAAWAARLPKTAPDRPKARERSLGSYNGKVVRRGRRRLGVAPTGFDV